MKLTNREWQKAEITSNPPELLLLDIETPYSSAGVLIWHIMEDRIFISEKLCRMMRVSKTGLLNLEFKFWLNAECELRQYLRNILEQVCLSESADASFKTKIPGIQKEISGSVQLFDREDLGIMDLMLICWEEDRA